MGFLPSDIEECNFFVGFLAEGYAEWKLNACDISQDIRTLTVMEKTHSNKEGNDMTYSQAYLFCEYMTEIYGDDFMIESLKSEDSFEVTYGKKYSEIRADFLKQMYE